MGLPHMLAQDTPEQPPAKAGGGAGAIDSVAAKLAEAKMTAETVVDYILKMLAEYGFKVLGALVILLAAWIIAGWGRRIARAAMDRAKFDPTAAKFASNAVRYLVLTIGLLSSLPLFGVNITAMAAMLGAGGLAVGLASQGALSSMAAGLMLLITRPFKVGDVVVLDDHLGMVHEIDLFSTKLNTLDNRRVIIPNAAIFGKVIENITHNPNRRVDIVVGVSYATDLDAARESILSSLAGTALVLRDPAAAVVLREFADSAITFDVRAWVLTKEFINGKHEVIRAIKRGFDRDGIEIPFPQRVVWMRRSAGDPDA